MQALSVSASFSVPAQSYHARLRCLSASPHLQYHRQLQHPSSFLGSISPLRVPTKRQGMVMKKREGIVCYAAPLSAANLQWVATISTAVLMLVKGTAIHKSFLAPLFALQAPISIVSWIKGEYGIWTAFLAVLVRLFFPFPGELELPFMALLLVIVAPYRLMDLRGSQEGVIISLVIAAYMAFQHFSRAGSLQRATEQVSIIPTVAIICTVAVPCLLLI